jgi:hypothetical protein
MKGLRAGKSISYRLVFENLASTGFEPWQTPVNRAETPIASI